MKKIILLLLATTAASAQLSVKSPSDFFPKSKTQVLVVGTFHFDYPGLDAHKTDESNKIDVLREPKKSEVTQLVDYIKRFKPTKIVIEAMPNWQATEKLKRYKAGEFRNQRDERFQLGMRIATELQLDTIYALDALPFDLELEKLDTVYFKKFFEDFDFKSNDPMAAKFTDWYRYEETLQKSMTLLDYFKRFNARESHELTYGAYLVGDFKLDDTRGADILSIWWYNRNLRIFRKLQQITESPTDRLLVIFGNGHAALLRQLLECSPEYDFVEFDGLK
ncbi:DUF5694 domain-containing protein [Flavobacterium caeni]|uniref:TraB family protein n=1 Tax=Flavobacterium caeni TaxID=490189 RepID=A0A1G5IYJ9_9FLAO|nr:DUF5694 domain-containing protein [Flavobacterium caeni]SCY80790.1 hypothetical protein SAMN02927903_02457 [Flavobacterium caeni]